MKTTIRFSKLFGICALVSALIILSGFGAALWEGINFGLDFKPGLQVQVSIRSENVPQINADEVRGALASYKGVEVKTVGGSGEWSSFQIRLGIEKNKSSKIQTDEIHGLLNKAFGAAHVFIDKSDFIGSQFSKELIRKSILLVVATLVLIWLYTAIRFKWDFALGAIIALLHDTFIMIAFIVWSQMEFSNTTIAAILTIIGYSVNATVVILDRVRENIAKYPEEKDFTMIFDRSLKETLSRSLITTITTMFASIALFVFTTGDIKNFAAVLTVGLVSGCYSSIYISSGFICFIRKFRRPKNLPDGSAIKADSAVI
jgi:preprotein translocase subunit SecF